MAVSETNRPIPKAYLLLFSILMVASAFNSCTKTGYPQLVGDHALIKEITIAGVLNTKFEYKDGRLTLHELFASCPDPITEERYNYKDGLLHEIQIRTGAASAIACPGIGGMTSIHTFVYDHLKRPIRIDRTSESGHGSYMLLSYEGSSKLVNKVVTYNAETDQAYNSIEYHYDARGNIIEVIEPMGTTYYTYDNKTNPFYLINRSVWFISPFNNSPNNVIEATGATNFKTQILEYQNDLPVRVLESNGVEYTYHY